MPAHAGDGGALRRAWNAARAGGDCRSLLSFAALHLKCRWAPSAARTSTSAFEAITNLVRAEVSGTVE